MTLKKILPFLAAVALLSVSCTQKKVEEFRSTIDSTPMLYGVEAVSQVYVESTDEEGSIMKYFGNRSIVVPVRATVKAGINLQDITDMKVKGRTIYITLPDPVIEIESTAIEYGEIISDVSGFRDEFSNAEVAALASEGRKKIEETLPYLGLVERAQQQAEQTLSAIAEEVGMNIVFSQRKKYQEKDLIKLVK